MNDDKNEKWIFAVLQDEGYYPERLIDPEGLDNLEYADVRDGEYQLWHWPTGDIFELHPDREVESHNEYSVPHSNKGVIWLPILKKVDSNKSKVKAALESLIK